MEQQGEILLDRHPEIDVTKEIAAKVTWSWDINILGLLLDRVQDVYITPEMLEVVVNEINVLKLLLDRQPNL